MNGYWSFKFELLQNRTYYARMSKTKYSSFKSVEKFAEPNSPLSKVLYRASKILNHQQTVRAAIEPSCRPHCWLANYRNGTLYLQTDSSVWATRLRMQQRAIIQQLKKTTVFSALHSVKVSIQPRSTIEKKPQSAKPISAVNAQQLLETAADTDDPALKAALIHLAKNGQREEND